MKIKNKHGEHIISVDDNGRIWRTDDEGKSWFDIGYIVNHVCNVYQIHGLVDYNAEKYVPVVEDVLKYRRELDLKSLRRAFYKNRMTSVGAIEKVNYGYITRNSFKDLLSKRKVLRKRPQGLPVVLTKIADWEFHSK